MPGIRPYIVGVFVNPPKYTDTTFYVCKIVNVIEVSYTPGIDWLFF